MSEKSTSLTPEHFAYIASHTTREDAYLADLKQAARQAAIPAIWIAPEQAACMQILLRLAGARQVVEVGTLAGYSAIAMARALPPDGRVRTIEINPTYADFARRWIADSDVANRVELHFGSGADVLPSFEANSADGAFLDADKANYPLYLRECLRIVRPGGLIMADNAFAFGQLFDERPTDREAPAVREFNEYIAGVAELQSIIIPLGDGFWVGVKT